MDHRGLAWLCPFTYCGWPTSSWNSYIFVEFRKIFKPIKRLLKKVALTWLCHSSLQMRNIHTLYRVSIGHIPKAKSIQFAYTFTVPKFYTHLEACTFVYSKCTCQVYTSKHTPWNIPNWSTAYVYSV